jgi:scytalone dehydratase
MESEEWISILSSPNFVGDPLVHTQHLLGAVIYECVTEDEVIAIHQIRAAHQRYSDPSLINVAYRGHAYGSVKHWYKRFGKNWKLAGVCPEMYWNEHDFSKIFPRQPSAP